MSDYIADIINSLVYWVSALFVVGGVFILIDNHRYYLDYLESRGMGWHDVKYFAWLNVGGYGFAVSFVSKNLDKLYR